MSKEIYHKRETLCNRDCFNCIYEDCILDGDTSESTYIDKIVRSELVANNNGPGSKYNHSKKGKERIKKYLKSEKGKKAQRRYNQSEKGKASRRKAQNTDSVRKSKREYYYRKKAEKIKAELLLAKCEKVGS